MAELIDLTHPLEDAQAAYPGDPPLRIRDHHTIETAGLNLRSLAFGTHQGTHLDAPSHFCAEGRAVDQIPLDRFFGPARLVDLAPDGALMAKAPLTVEMLEAHVEAFTPGGRVLLRTGWDRQFGRPEFFTDPPSLTLEAARWIADRRIGLLGMDMPTPSTTAGRECHRVLLAEEVEIVIVEGLANLDRLPDRFTFIGFPLNLTGCDGSPIRAVALIE